MTTRADFLRVTAHHAHVELVVDGEGASSVEVVPNDPDRGADRAAAAAVSIVRGDDGITVTVTARPAALGAGGAVRVRARMPEGSGAALTLRYGSTVVRGPAGALTVAVDSGDASIERTSRADLRVGHGELRVDAVRGDADVVITSGRTRIGRVDGALRLTGSDAGIDVASVGGVAEIVTASGVVRIGDPGPAATVRSAHGPVSIESVTGGVTRVSAAHGAVAVGVPEGLALWLDAASRHGIVRSELSATDAPAAGDGSGQLYVRTGRGDITVHRRRPTARERSAAA